MALLRPDSKPRLIFISNIAAPYQVKYCSVLQEYYDAQFWFYEKASGKRPYWWDIPLGNNCSILNFTLFRSMGWYFSPFLPLKLRKNRPDILILGGFLIPSNILSFLWAKLKRVNVFIMSETLRKKDSTTGHLQLRNRGFKNKLITTLFKSCTGIISTNQEAYDQFSAIKVFAKKTILLEYPNDIDSYFHHEYREPKHHCKLLFANRLIDTYNPIFALNVLAKLQSLRTDISFHLLMNSEGAMKEECSEYVTSNNIRNVSFIDSVDSWENLPLVYQKTDILILPAKFSNGNFTIIEAMASGMGIVISNNILGTGKYITNGVNGFALSLDCDLHAEAVLQYITNNLLFAEHAVINRSIANTFTMSVLAKKYYLSVDGCLNNQEILY